MSTEPQVGNIVKYTAKGAAAVGKSEGDLVGTIENFGTPLDRKSNTICEIKTPEGKPDWFIWKFPDGVLNDHITWSSTL